MRTFFLAVAACSVLVVTTHAFSVAPKPALSSRSPTSRSSALHLVPGQGSQLVAAFHASSGSRGSPKNATKSATVPHNEHIATTTTSSMPVIAVKSAAKAVVSRIFSIPGAILGRHPAAAPALVDITGPRHHERDDDDDEDDDVVLYPIRGFTFVSQKGDDGSTEFRALPSHTATNAACRIVHTADHFVYGWYAPSCPLDQSVWDDASYGKAPATGKVLPESEEKKRAL